MAAPARVAVKKAIVDKSSLLYKFRRWYYYQSWFPELGLLKDDIVMIAGPHKPVIQEAIRRMPIEDQEARTWRIERANQLIMEKTVLPKEQWTEYDNDKPYLQPTNNGKNSFTYRTMDRI